ncbi:MAG: molybdate ABC transporter permease subunit [Candidatus Methanogranum gryphiswaldense]|jgi:molybdate transport system permease protein|nr:MAG: molybdate ABC transporter permease subunit [Candidatus Methanogranum sp. U3.2.1]
MDWLITNWSPFWISLKVAGLATIFAVVTGILAAWLVNRVNRGKAILDAIFILPLILPPTVLGFLILETVSIHSPIGVFFLDIGIKFTMDWKGAVLASTIVAFPLMYRSVRGSLEAFDDNILNAGRTLGMSERSMFISVILPNIVPGIVAGSILAFARALGEFGATIMVAGNIINKTQTMSIAVWSAYSGGNMELAYNWVIVLIAISFIVIVLMNWITYRQKKLIRGK